jgi:hypothetical protein
LPRYVHGRKNRVEGYWLAQTPRASCRAVHPPPWQDVRAEKRAIRRSREGCAPQSSFLPLFREKTNTNKYHILYMYIYIIIAYLLRVYIYAQIIFISSIFVRLFVHHHLKHIFMNHSYCFDETPLGQVTQVTRRYCRTWRLTPFSSSAVRLGDDENFPNIFLEFQILVRKNINPRSRVNILQNILENILENIFIYTRKLLQRRTFISVVIDTSIETYDIIYL